MEVKLSKALRGGNIEEAHPDNKLYLERRKGQMLRPLVIQQRPSSAPHTTADLKDGPWRAAGKSITNAQLGFGHPRPDPNMQTKDPEVDHPQPPEITAGESWAERSLGTTVRAKCVLCAVGGKEGNAFHVSTLRVYYPGRGLHEARNHKETHHSIEFLHF